MPHVPVNEAPGSSRTRASPVRKAFGGQVIGSTATLRRLTVHADSVRADLALPESVPLELLIPAIVDIVAGNRGYRAASEAVRFQLSPIGGIALDSFDIRVRIHRNLLISPALQPGVARIADDREEPGPAVFATEIGKPPQGP